ncbi:hypothetical protein D3C72_2239440 [compost metagenome]
MALTGFERGFDYPYTVRLVTHQILIQVIGLENLFVLERTVGQLVGVVRHQHFLLPDQLPVVPVRRAVIHIHRVIGAQPVRGHCR